MYRWKPRSVGATVRECCRVLSATFLSLCLPLSFLLLARLSTARYFLSLADLTTIQPPPKFPFQITIFVFSTTPLILSFLTSLVTVAALIHCLTSSTRKAAFATISGRHRLYAAWLLLSWMQVFMVLGIQGTVDAEDKSHTVGRLVVPRRLIFALGLHGTTVFWWATVVKPVVDTAISGFSREGFAWAETAVLAATFGNLWWRRLKDEAEALVVLPLRMDVGVTDVLGWVLYHLTLAIGLIRVAKGIQSVLWWIFRKGSNGGVVIPITCSKQSA